jgi:hypothetical protein
MSSSNLSALMRAPALSIAIKYANKSIDSILSKVKKAATKVLQVAEIEVEGIKEEVWEDLSALYYKYEDNDQKKAFREIMHEISEKINENKWDTIYKKLYRIGQNSFLK